MGWHGSYLWRLRQHVGHDVVLMPGAATLVEHVDGRVLFVQRADNGEWCHPGGHAEVGQSFLDAARNELREEAGLDLDADRFEAFASISDPGIHTVTYANGDVTQCFTMWFRVIGWDGDVDALSTDEESTALGLFDPSRPPSPLSAPTARALTLHDRFRRTGRFQAD